MNIATGATAAKTVNIATAAPLVHTLTIGTPSSTTLLQGSTVTIASSTDALTLNLGANTGRHTINIATGQASSTVNIGSSSSTIVVNNFWIALPTSPVDGQEIIYAASSTANVYWHLKYNASAAKWFKIGGPPLHATTILTDETTTSTSYTDLTTVGPYLTVPLAGAYNVSIGGSIRNNTSGQSAFASPALGGTAANDNNSIESNAYSANNSQQSLWRVLSNKTLSAGDLVKLQYRVSANTGAFARRELLVDPIYVQ